jgi:hypothetical protein
MKNIYWKKLQSSERFRFFGKLVRFLEGFMYFNNMI